MGLVRPSYSLNNVALDEWLDELKSLKDYIAILEEKQMKYMHKLILTLFQFKIGVKITMILKWGIKSLRQVI